MVLVLMIQEVFSPGAAVFPSPQKPTFPNSNSIWIMNKALHHEPQAWEIAQAQPFLFTTFLAGVVQLT